MAHNEVLLFVQRFLSPSSWDHPVNMNQCSDDWVLLFAQPSRHAIAARSTSTASLALMPDLNYG